MKSVMKEIQNNIYFVKDYKYIYLLDLINNKVYPILESSYS
jgi:hypothetical protein